MVFHCGFDKVTLLEKLRSNAARCSLGTVKFLTFVTGQANAESR